MNIKNHIPNLFTCLNLAIGCLAIAAVFEGNLSIIIYYIFIAGIFDFFDGFAARLLKATSPIGKDLDSLADMVTFGLVPSLLMYQMLKANASVSSLSYTAFLIAVFSGLRLAKFNNDDRQSDAFYGLPTPANALFICSLPLLIESEFPFYWLQNEYTLILIIIVSSTLMVLDIKLLALKFNGFGWKSNELRYMMIILSGLLLAYFGLIALPFTIIIYLLLSILAGFFAKT